ncbi:hypothetical protein LEMA_P060580.1 [Plenodomus lingam JN3]|uniref:Uncharacterized protein n=1 Tax=Leptosphaeria maculans (strain JN3 / isolate v23.1.3 / race Av1-4-5-6-7-8) TaxID=985895 RepID=E4ZIK3_LEPMJ|nr:hypothetical protein LEMA_P060580.1 [Plenodomus lingam JN3]CBX91024.1 hypothetical protein LEMA_P060580.1 [Plenodomus lingam JN3]
MGRNTTPIPPYRDNPDAVPLHTTPNNYTYPDTPDLDSAALPPPYSESEASTAPPASQPPIHHSPPPTTRTKHTSPTFKNGHPVICSTRTLIDPLLDTDPVLLEKTIRANAQIPPVQYIHILGTHRETTTTNNNTSNRRNKTESSTTSTDVTDFRLVLNITPYLHPNFNSADISPMRLSTIDNNTRAFRGGITQTRGPTSHTPTDLESSSAAPPAPKPSLTEWTHRYCASGARLRSFRLQREVTGLRTTLLAQRIEALIRSTQYRGHVSITFPVEDAHLDIYTACFMNRWRLVPWVRWVFYLSFLWLFAWPVLFLATRRYAVVRAQWPFSVEDGRGEAVYTTVSEEQWVGRWGVALKRLVLEGWDGEVSEEVMRGLEAREGDSRMPGLGAGWEGADGVLEVVAQGVRVARAVQTGMLERGLLGGWGYDC